MPNYAELEAEMQRLWDEANVLVANYPFDVHRGALLEKKLIGCAILARDAGRPFGARQLESAAGVLAAKIKTATQS
jgi:hypothetical protein